jgi:hypothetical protein
MRIEVVDWYMSARTIDTRSARLAGDWLAEQCRDLMSADTTLPDCRLRIWPSTHEEAKLIGDQEHSINQDDLLHLAAVILTASQKLADRE